MRHILIILIFFSLSVQAQPSRTVIYEPVKVIMIYTASIVLSAVGDGLCDSGEKTWGHTLNAASVGLLLMSPLFLDMNKDNWWWYLASYVSLRIALFDYTYNATRGLPLNYIGGTSYWDKMLGEINPPTTAFHRGVFFVVGIAIPIKEL